MALNTAINALTAPDAYGAASTISAARAIDFIVVTVINNPIYYQLKEFTDQQGGPAAGYFNGIDVQMFPGSKVLDRDGICGIKFRAFTPAASLPAGSIQAVVTVEAVFYA